MTIEEFKKLPLEEKLNQLRHHGELQGSYERRNENGDGKTTGDIFSLADFWVFLSDDETMVIPSRRNVLAVTEEE